MSMPVRQVAFASSFTVPVPDRSTPDTTAVAQALARALTARLARNVALSSDHLSFEGPGHFAVAPWSLLTPVDRGELQLEAQARVLRIEYRLVYTRLAILSSIVALLGGAFSALSWGWPVGIVAFVFFELVLCVGNLSSSLTRARHFCQRVAWDTINRPNTGRLTSA
jgi:hypothetical protein